MLNTLYRAESPAAMFSSVQAGLRLSFTRAEPVCTLYACRPPQKKQKVDKDKEVRHV